MSRLSNIGIIIRMLIIKLRDFVVIAIEHICDAIMCFTLIEKRCRPL